MLFANVSISVAWCGLCRTCGTNCLLVFMKSQDISEVNKFNETSVTVLWLTEGDDTIMSISGCKREK